MVYGLHFYVKCVTPVFKSRQLYRQGNETPSADHVNERNELNVTNILKKNSF
jgi:hypothetical protein